VRNSWLDQAYKISASAVQGLNLARSNSPVGNFFVNYTNVVIAVWNLNAFSLPAEISQKSIGSAWAYYFGITDPTLWYWVGLANILIFYVAIPLGIIYALGARIFSQYLGLLFATSSSDI